MKRFTYYLLSFVITALTLNSCTPEVPSFDKTLLVGKWVSTTAPGTEYYR
jgi:hypothetical protein